jgi:hypothetical protein
MDEQVLVERKVKQFVDKFLSQSWAFFLIRNREILMQ